MLKYRRIIHNTARRIASAANRTVHEYVANRVEHEPEFTGEMLGRMKEAMNGYITKGVRWTAKVFTSQGSKAQEHKFGADFMGVVEFDLPEYRVAKGFLAQSKRIEPGQQIKPAEWRRMVEQCEQMLAITTECFVFIYASSGIVVVPALTIASATSPTNPHEFYSRNVLRFYENHFECFIGDRNICSAQIATIESLQAKRGLHLTALPTQQSLGLKSADDRAF